MKRRTGILVLGLALLPALGGCRTVARIALVGTVVAAEVLVDGHGHDDCRGTQPGARDPRRRHR